MSDRNEELRLRQLLVFEEEAASQGYRVIAGLDEAGRGPLAGPVVAAACIWRGESLLRGVNDSKKLSPPRRRQLFESLTSTSSCIFGLGIISSEEVDRLNIFQATKVAMLEAIRVLSEKPDYLLIDGLALPESLIPHQKVIQGDAKSYSIAAASIIAKETRDRLMLAFHEQWPHYGFDQHKGYGTAAHRAAIEKYGPCPIHRKTFAPVRKCV